VESIRSIGLVGEAYSSLEETILFSNEILANIEEPFSGNLDIKHNLDIVQDLI